MRHIIIFISLCLFCGIGMAQSVSNARFVQDGKTIRIYYDLSEKADISIYLSTDGGRSYESSPLTNVTGDVGLDVLAGRDKKAVWDVLASRERLQGNKVCFKVRAAGQGSNRTITVNGVSFTMVYVAGGTFTMGCTSEQGGDCYGDEKPSHRVTLTDYYIGETEVTQKLWQAVMGSNPSHFKGEQRPVDNVSWDDCQEFIRRLNSKTGLRFALPTEAQWEYAARGGSKSRGYKYCGSNTIGTVAWYDGNSGNQSHNVKGKQPNELGLYDMSGNVYEWCSDWYGEYPSSSQTNPAGLSSGLNRVLRGGSWFYNVGICRVANRGSYDPSYRHINRGLRLVLLPEGQPVNEVIEEVPPQKTYMDNSQYVDLGLPSGTLWKKENEPGGFYTYDEAVRKFGNKLPTKEQLRELKEKCRWLWNGNGCKVIGPNGNSIVLPAAGWRDCDGSVNYVGSFGRYWSSMPNGSDYAWYLNLFSNSVDVYSYGRCDGFSVRLVQD